LIETALLPIMVHHKTLLIAYMPTVIFFYDASVLEWFINKV